jgi:methionine-rich copper-binding protein CopC
MNSLSDLQTIDYAGDIRVDALLNDVNPWNFVLPYRNTLYYTFDVSSGSWIDGAVAPQLTAFSVNQSSAARALMSYVSALIGVNFVEVATSSSADIHFGAANIPYTNTIGLSGTEYSYHYSGNTLTQLAADAFVLLDNAEFFSDTANLSSGGLGFEVLLHEIGHSLGLGHPFEGPYVLSPANDNTNNTVMSYTDAGSYKSQFQSYDLLALQWLYGGDGLAGTWGENSLNGPSLSTAGPGPDPDPQPELDTQPPTVATFSPGDGSSGVSIDAVLALTFNENIERGTGSFVLKTIWGTVVEVFDAASSSRLQLMGNTLTVTPSQPFAHDTEYRLEWTQGALRDSAGNPVAARSNYDFRTEPPPDDLPPQLDAISPLSGAVNMVVSANIVLTFDEAISRGNGTAVLKLASGQMVESFNLASSPRVSINGPQLTINPLLALDYSQQYLLDIPFGGVLDLAGNPYGGLLSHSFTTTPPPDTTPPTLTSLAPANGASDVSLTSHLVLQFSENIARGSGSMLLKTASGQLVESFTASSSSQLVFDGNQLRIDPTQALLPATHYRVELPAGSVKDKAGNLLTTPLSYNFSTQGAQITGTAAANHLAGTWASDTIDAGAGNDHINGKGGNDNINGGGGIDTLVVDTTLANVLAHADQLLFTPGNLARIGSSLGVVTLTQVERVQLQDGLFAFDTTGPSPTLPEGGSVWQAASIYQLAFGALPGRAELSRWTAEADSLGNMAELAQRFVDTHAPGISHTALVAYLYQQVMGQPASDATVAVLASQIGPGRNYPQAGDLVAMAASLDTQQAKLVGFVGSVQTLDASYF